MPAMIFNFFQEVDKLNPLLQLLEQEKYLTGWTAVCLMVVTAIAVVKSKWPLAAAMFMSSLVMSFFTHQLWTSNNPQAGEQAVVAVTYAIAITIIVGMTLEKTFDSMEQKLSFVFLYSLLVTVALTCANRLHTEYLQHTGSLYAFWLYITSILWLLDALLVIALLYVLLRQGYALYRGWSDLRWAQSRLNEESPAETPTTTTHVVDPVVTGDGLHFHPSKDNQR